MGRTGLNWTLEETILAFDLYCKTPFSKISQTNKEIMELANLIGRSPGAVALKMHNLAHFDPELQKRNVKAMSNGSKLDSQVWEDFSGNWSELSFRAQKLLAELNHENVEYRIDDPVLKSFPEGREREQLVRMRINQDFFRKSVLASYGNRCCITMLPIPELLNASHIKPWKDCDPKTEMLNPSNGLSLNTFHDRAFDGGFITIDTNYCIKISSLVRRKEKVENIRDWLLKYEGEKIQLPHRFMPSKVYLEYHNDVVFRRD